MGRVGVSGAARAARAGPWTGVLALTTAFQVVRREPVDVIVFGGALLLVVLDALLPDGLTLLRGHRVLRTRPSRGVLVVAALVVGGSLVAAPRHGAVSVALLAVVGAVVTAFALVGDGGGTVAAGQLSPVDRARSRRTELLWAGVIVAAGVIEATSFVLGRLGVTDDSTMPSISDLLDPLLDDPRWDALYVAVWLAAGIALLRRGRFTEVTPWEPSR